MRQKLKKRTKRVPGQVLVDNTLPEGWRYHSVGRITPTLGLYAGNPIEPSSQTAKLLGWPGPCLTGELDITTKDRFGRERNLHKDHLRKLSINETDNSTNDGLPSGRYRRG